MDRITLRRRIHDATRPAVEETAGPIAPPGRVISQGGVLRVGGVLALVACAACSGTMAYVGTGSLQTSGATAPDLASHTVAMMNCGAEGQRDAVAGGEVVSQPVSPPFTVLRVSRDCIIDGVGAGDQFVADTGGVCTLAFDDGLRTLRVTDVLVRYGVSADEAGQLQPNQNLLELTLGGDDIATGAHAVYRFTGGGKPVARGAAQCTAQRSVHDHYLSARKNGV